MFVGIFSKVFKFIATLDLHKIPMGKQNRCCYHKNKIQREKLSCLRIHNKLFIGRAITRICVFSGFFFSILIPLFYHNFFMLSYYSHPFILFKISYRKLSMWTYILPSKSHNKLFANYFTTEIYFFKIF